MKPKKPEIIITIIIAIVVVIAGGLFLTNKIPNTASTSLLEEAKDEFTGTWRGEGITKENYKWFVVYTFKNGTYDMTTDSAVKDNGTYVITKRFEDKSIQITKTSVPFNKTYDVFNVFSDNGDTLSIEGMKFHRVK